MENQNIVDLTKDMDMNVVLDTLNTMRDDVDGICKSDELRKFVYRVSDERNYSVATKNGNKLRFNLFELKIKAQ